MCGAVRLDGEVVRGGFCGSYIHHHAHYDPPDRGFIAQLYSLQCPAAQASKKKLKIQCKLCGKVKLNFARSPLTGQGPFASLRI
ncbi:hypothetical protein ACLKA6_019821 [Drosophila palustris]